MPWDLVCMTGSTSGQAASARQQHENGKRPMLKPSNLWSQTYRECPIVRHAAASERDLAHSCGFPPTAAVRCVAIPGLPQPRAESNMFKPADFGISVHV